MMPVVGLFIAAGIFMAFSGNAPVKLVGLVLFVVGFGLAGAIMLRGRQLNAYFRQDRP
jgi:hypothetical protein